MHEFLPSPCTASTHVTRRQQKASLRSWRYCEGARLKKKGVETITRLYYNASAAKSHSSTTQYRQLRRLTKSPRDQENSFLSEKCNLHMDKRCSSRWLLVSVQRVATLIKRSDSFIYTKKSNSIDSSRCSYSSRGQKGRSKFPFHKQVAAIFKTVRKVLICY